MRTERARSVDATAARLSEAVYDRHDLAQTADRVGLDIVAVIEGDSQRAAVLRHGRAVWITVRGTDTDSLGSLLRNVRYGQRAVDNTHTRGRVHRGFQGGADDLVIGIDDALPDCSKRRLRWCGHSQGGAVAAILAGRLSGRSVTMLGSPRPGDDAFQDHLAERGIALRWYCHGQDPVPWVPTRWIPHVWPPGLASYRHSGSGFYIEPATGEARDDWSLAEVRDRTLASVRGLVPGAITGWGDHSVAHYRRALEG